MKKIVYTVMAAFAVLMINGCQKSPSEIMDSVDNYVEVGNSYSFIDYTFTLSIVDAANPGSFVENAEVEISGRDADYIFESGGSRDFTPIQGTLFMVANPSYEPTQENPLQFVAKITAPGYLPVIVDASIFKNNPNRYQTVFMVNEANPPAGASRSSSQFPLSGGVLAAEQEVSVFPGAGKLTGGTVTIPAGTKFYDANGSQLTGSSLKANMIHFDSGNSASMACFPGGQVAPLIKMGDDYFPKIGVFPLTFADIYMTVGNNKVKTFSQPINISMTISPGTLNTETGLEIAEGDVLKMFSYSENEGFWKYEMDAEVEIVN